MTERLRAAAQALVARWDSPQWGGSAEHLRHTGEHIAELRAALAEQPAEQAPVAAQCRFEGETEWNHCTVAHHLHVQAHPTEWPHYKTRALYTAPQPAKRVPLTDEWIRERCPQTWVFETVKRWVREVESAHGITGETK